MNERLLLQQERLLQTMLDYSPISVIVLDTSGTILRTNPYTWEMSGYEDHELVGRPLHMLSECPVADIQYVLQGNKKRFESYLVHKSGYRVDLQITAAPVAIDENVSHVLFICQDISERRRINDRIRYLSNYDDMTGLPNRKQFMDHLDNALELYRDRYIAVLYLDLDRFKLINDSFGQEFGDMLLMQVAERLTRCVTERDMVARMDGDEFALFFVDVESESEALQKGELITQLLEEPFVLQDHPFLLTASIGIAMNEDRNDDPGSLIKKANIALTLVKEQGRNNYRGYSPDMNMKSLERLTLQHDLRKAMSNREFVLHYQPQIEMETGRIVGAEALLRWNHPVKGMVSPSVFIPLAEENGLIVPLGEWVLEEACRQNKAWQDAGLPPIPVSVNLSVRQFLLQNLYEKVEHVLKKTGLDARYLDLEITESMTMDVDRASHCLMELSKLGIRISIDDFGTGYSSLSYLKNFSINRLKIDRSFVRDIMQDPNDAAIVAAIIAMAHNLNLQVIAEGVETEEQLDFLKEHRCDEIQGYYYSPPVPVQQLEEMLLAM
ncbi:EAL domain-containing protein [Paenibacillus sp. MSJ-34]|nr:EAL domain-containing protein [Paenibacillus sp. MSJ-34]